MKTINTNNEMAFTFGKRSNQTKIERYNWGKKDSPGEFKSIHKNEILIEPSYQRERISYDKVRMIASDFSWVALGAIVVGFRDGLYWAIDGQHRVLAAKQRADIEYLPCMVFNTFSIQEEAKGFLNVNTGRRAITSIDKYKAAIAADNEIAKFVESTFAEFGIVAKHNAVNPREIKALDWALTRAAENKSAFKVVLSVSADLCHSIPITNLLLDGLYYIHTNTQETLLDKRVLAKINKIGASGLIQAAKRASAYFASGGASVWADGMLKEINKGLREKIVFTK